MTDRLALIILDGWGIGEDPSVDAIAQADTPYWDDLIDHYPHAELTTYGEAVGLPDGQIGNSEVGHMNLGAGRIIYQELLKINRAIVSGDFAENPVLCTALDEAGQAGRRVHLIGLTSRGGVHAHLSHLLALCDMTQRYALPEVYIHAFTDGRDVDPDSARKDIADVLEHTHGQSVELASIIGRYYAMDRDHRWERTGRAYDLLVHGAGQGVSDVLTAIESSYARGITDEFLEPMYLERVDGTIRAEDLVIFFNFRTDRPRQLTEMLTMPGIYGDREIEWGVSRFISMTRYDHRYEQVQVVYDQESLQDTLGATLSKLSKTQLRAAETEKYPHVSFFFNGGVEEPDPGEYRILIPSPKVATYDLQPSMSAIPLTDSVLKYIEESCPDFICLNYANTDMVGHTGDMEAAMDAAETVDRCLLRLVPVLLDNGYEVILLADHGNADCMKHPDGSPHTAHTLNPVPIVFLSSHPERYRLQDGVLADIAPTILHQMGLEIPQRMDGKLLISRSDAVS